jgi:hypothetical protein
MSFYQVQTAKDLVLDSARRALLLDFSRRFVTSLGNDLVFNGFPLLIPDAQRLIRGRVDEFNFYTAEFAITSHVCRVICERILVAKCHLYLSKDAGILCQIAWKKREPARFLRKRLHFVVGLQEIHLRYTRTHAAPAFHQKSSDL